MTYGLQKLRKTKEPNHANAHRAHLRVLERRRRESSKEIIEACKQTDAVFQAEREARRVAAEAAAVIAASQPKLSKMGARAAAAKAKWVRGLCHAPNVRV